MNSEEITISFKKEAAEESKKKVGENIFDKAARTIFYIFGFLLPLWVLPITIFPLELNKAYLAYFLIIFSFLLWLVGRVKTNFINLPKSFFLISLVLLFFCELTNG